MIDNGLSEEWLRNWGYLMLFIPLTLETAGIPMPGGTILLIAAAAFPCSLFAALAGLPWPAALDAGHTFGAFVTMLILLIAFADYARRPAPLPTSALPTTAVNASAHRATSEFRRALG